jgi:YfiH family protein
MILPTSSPSFRWIEVSNGPALVCDALDRVAQHLFTTRSWPLGAANGGAPMSGWREVANSVGVDEAALVRVRQVHGARVDVWRAGTPRASPERAEREAEADIIVSDDPMRALAVRVADCVPLLVADQRTGAVAAAHAGWRGLAAGVPRVTVEALTREFGSRPDDLVAAIGPAISACCYEIGVDVRHRFEAAGYREVDLDRWFLLAPALLPSNPPMANLPSTPRPDHWYFDAWAATRDTLHAAGVPLGCVYAAELCTASHPATFCSYRRDGKDAGRLAAVIRAGRARYKSHV